jgi:HRAS-like suppressor 3
MQQTPPASAAEAIAAPAASGSAAAENGCGASQSRCRKADAINATTELATSRYPYFPLGAHIVTPRRWYRHHGIYVGAGEVVHYQGLSSSLRRGRVTKVSLAEFSHGHSVRVQGEADMAYSGLEVAARACSRLGEDAYDVLLNNCEHFCFWCLIGVSRSPQVERLFSSARAVELVARLLASAVNLWSNARHALPLIS